MEVAQGERVDYSDFAGRMSQECGYKTTCDCTITTREILSDAATCPAGCHL